MIFYLLTFALGIFAIGNPVIAQDHLGLELAGQVRGNCSVVASSGDNAFIAYENILRVVDISDVSNPTVLSSWEAPVMIWSIAAAEEYVYLALRERGLVVLDVSDPARPQEIASLGTRPYIRDMQIAGDRLYLAADWFGVSVVDISNAREPEILLDAEIDGWGYDVAPAGDLVYVSSFQTGLQILEMAENGWNQIGSLRFQNVTYTVAVSGDYAFLGGTPDIGLRVVNIADPQNPREVDYFDELQGGDYSLDIFEDFLVVGAAGGVNNAGGGVHLFDISDPENTEYIGYYLTPRATSLKFHGRYVLASGDDFLILDTAPAQQNPTINIPEEQLDLDFGEVIAGNAAEIGITVSNVGFPNLIIDGMQAEDEAFTVTTPDRRWNELDGFPAGEIVEDSRLSGVEFDGTNFYVSGGSNGEVENFIYVFDLNGELVSSFPQFNESAWGMRDLAWDGELLWGGDDDVIYGFSTEGELVTSLESPVDIIRALTYDYSRELLWIADAASALYGIDRAGNLVSTVERTWDTRIYGLASSPVDPDIYFFASDERDELAVYRCSPDSGEVEFLHAFEGELNERASGATISTEINHPATTLIGVIDGVDRIGMWQMTDHYLGGDILIEPETAIELTIHFAPPRVGMFESNLIISTNDPENEEVTISLIGVGIAGGEPEWVDLPGEVVETEGELIDFIVCGMDPDSQPLTIRCAREELPYDARFEDHSNGEGRFLWRPKDGCSGEYDLAFTLSDGVNEVTANVPITVRSPNEAGSVDGNIPTSFELAALYPNPFNSSTRFSITIPESGKVRVSLFDLTGREVVTSSERSLSAGRHNMTVNGDNLPAGVYTLQIECQGQTQSQKVTLIR